MKRLVAAIFACLVCATFAWGASNAASVNFLDAEILSKDAGASFHWFPIQKTFILVTAKDTAKFAVGIPFVSHNSNVMELAASPKARVFGAEFLRRVGMANAGAVSKAIKRLQDHDLIYEINGGYRFGDSFFRQWILRSV